MQAASNIVFYGTPLFAQESLKALVEGGYHIAAVVTAPDKPAGRGMKLKVSAVGQYALAQGLTVLQPPRLRDPAFLDRLKQLEPELQVVVAFRMMPKEVWAMPRLGTFNLHASLLPQYRGAAPINWAIINGETETGLTTFFLQDKVDTGEIIFREKLPIGPDETAGELHDRMMVKGAELVVRTVQSVFAGNVTTIDQSLLTSHDSLLKSAPKIFSETCRIDWSRPSAEITNLIRGLSPSPGAFTELKMKDGTEGTMKIFRAGMKKPGTAASPGTLISDGRNHLAFSASDGDIYIYELQVPGRKPVKTEDFLRGAGRSII